LNSSTKNSNPKNKPETFIPSTIDLNDSNFHSSSNDIITDDGVNSIYNPDPNEYKKAKKRMQNRESALRSRMKKKTFYETVEVELH